MRLDKKREEELARRKGLAIKTIIQGVWLLISFAVAYYLSTYLIDQGVISYSQLYNQFFIPRVIPEPVLLGGLMLLIVIVMQFFLYVGFAFASPEGRRRSGTPTLHSRHPDPFDERRD
jgi:hypothetical protein